MTDEPSPGSAVPFCLSQIESFSMSSRLRSSSLSLLTLCMSITCSAVAQDFPKLEFIGSLSIQGDSTDLSADATLLGNGEPRNRLGGFSALDYSPKMNSLAALSDRGPDDGAVEYPCRVQVFELVIEPQATPVVTARNVSTILLKDATGRSFTGSSAALRPTAEFGHRLDPEGMRFSDTGTMFVSDEYGPELIEFSSDGTELRRLALPSHLRVRTSHADKVVETRSNQTGRASNRGMECLALSSDGQFLAGLMQGPLIQDGKREDGGKIVGKNCRLLQIELSTGNTREYVYQMEDAANGNSEILAYGPNQYLVLERDSKSGEKARYRRLVQIDLTNATDISGTESLPADQLPNTITPAARQDFCNFLDPRWNLAGSGMPEKIEGLTFGPNLRDGRRTLLVSTDNDFESKNPSLIWVFAVHSGS